MAKKTNFSTEKPDEDSSKIEEENEDLTTKSDLPTPSTPDKSTGEPAHSFPLPGEGEEPEGVPDYNPPEEEQPPTPPESEQQKYSTAYFIQQQIPYCEQCGAAHQNSMDGPICPENLSSDVCPRLKEHANSSNNA